MKTLILSLCLLMTLDLVLASERSRAGSFTFTVSQRFFNDDKLGHVNGFSQWGAIEFDAKFGLYEFPYRIEPYLGFGYIQDTANLYQLLSDGSYRLDDNGRKIQSQDKLKYRLFSFTGGVRHKAWEPEFFFVIPHVFAGLTYRYGRIQKVTYGVGQQKVNLGGDFGAEVGGGLIFSFFFDKQIRTGMTSDWELKDFSLISTLRYLPAGWGRHGLGLLEDTGGWDFGLGLFLDW